MEDGRRERIMIACVTFETVKITEPIKFYESTKVHLIHYVSPESKSRNIYSDFYDTVLNTIESYSNNIEIIEHVENVTDFSAMIKIVHSIIDGERRKSCNNDIFVNISAGSSEYVAAATITSMMFEGTIPFSVPTNEYMIDAKQYYDKITKKPIGLSKSVLDPKRVQQFNIDTPDRTIVLGLKILDAMNKQTHAAKGTKMIEALKKNNLWIRGEFPEESSKRSESTYYLRDFVNRWLDEGWVYHDKFIKKYFLTDKGKLILKTFYCDDEIII